MPLADRADFQSWLLRFQLTHPDLRPAPPAEPGGPARCQGCGVPVAVNDAPCGACMVCLAEQYGRQQAEAAARIGRTLLIALLEDRQTPIDPVRAEIEDVLADYEDVLARSEDLNELASLVAAAAQPDSAPADARPTGLV